MTASGKLSSDGKGKISAAKARRAARNQPIVARNSKSKLIMLSLPCLVAAGVGIAGPIVGINFLGGGTLTHIAAAAIGAFVAFVLLQMAFDGEPVLVIDEDGITCRRPDLGTIPWSAVLGLGTSKATLLRKVFMIAVDADELDPQARRHVRNRVGLFSAFSPQVAKFEGQMKGHPSIHIPLSYFDISIAEFERQLAERVKFRG